eukprot:6212789-Pleurochrysis_carterae.AAC.4
MEKGRGKREGRAREREEGEDGEGEDGEGEEGEGEGEGGRGTKKEGRGGLSKRKRCDRANLTAGANHAADFKTRKRPDSQIDARTRRLTLQQGMHTNARCPYELWCAS